MRPATVQTRSRQSSTAACVGFAPIAGADARILILGSLPSRRSLDRSQYYAHPQNAFWRIMAELYGATGDYEKRCNRLMAARVAVWDVLRQSVRPGSMDAAIRWDTAEVNDFRTFLENYPRIERIGFNGQKAAALFRRVVMPTLNGAVPELVLLPSTSPAYASLSFDKKLAIWRSILITD